MTFTYNLARMNMFLHGIAPENQTDPSIYETEVHMLKVLDVIINKSCISWAFRTAGEKPMRLYLPQAQYRYYSLLKAVKKGETSLVINEEIKQMLPDFLKFAITYSVSENEAGSKVN